MGLEKELLILGSAALFATGAIADKIDIEVEAHGVWMGVQDLVAYNNASMSITNTASRGFDDLDDTKAPAHPFGVSTYLVADDSDVPLQHSYIPFGSNLSFNVSMEDYGGFASTSKFATVNGLVDGPWAGIKLLNGVPGDIVNVSNGSEIDMTDYDGLIITPRPKMDIGDFRVEYDGVHIPIAFSFFSDGKVDFIEIYGVSSLVGNHAEQYMGDATLQQDGIYTADIVVPSAKSHFMYGVINPNL